MSAASAAAYTGVYFFGDSLTDVGNVQNVYAGLPHPPGAPAVIPGDPYDSQGRASNGDLWADGFAAGLGYSATPSSIGGNDYAYGGARTRYQVLGPPFLGILDQVNAYTGLPGDAEAGALYVLWGGANNLQDIIVGKTTDALGNPVPGVGGTVSDLALAIQTLYADGVRNLLVPNVPDLALVPRVAEYGSAAQVAAYQLTLAFNSLLASALVSLENSLAGLDIIEFDTYSALYDIVGDPGAYGLSNVTNRCYTGDDVGFTGGGSVCADPDSYLFWDGIHPTSAVHGILADRMLVAVVPEPGPLLLIAIGLLGLAARPGRYRRLTISGPVSGR